MVQGDESLWVHYHCYRVLEVSLCKRKMKTDEEMGDLECVFISQRINHGFQFIHRLYTDRQDGRLYVINTECIIWMECDFYDSTRHCILHIIVCITFLLWHDWDTLTFTSNIQYWNFSRVFFNSQTHLFDTLHIFSIHYRSLQTEIYLGNVHNMLKWDVMKQNSLYQLISINPVNYQWGLGIQTFFGIRVQRQKR